MPRQRRADMCFLHCRILFHSVCLIKAEHSTPAVFHYKQKPMYCYCYYCYYYYHHHHLRNNMQIKRWKYQPDLQIGAALPTSFSDNPVLFVKAKPQKAGWPRIKNNVFKVTIDIIPVAWNLHKTTFFIASCTPWWWESVVWNNDSVTTDFKSIECLQCDGNSCFHINNMHTGILKLNCKASGDLGGRDIWLGPHQTRGLSRMPLLYSQKQWFISL